MKKILALTIAVFCTVTLFAQKTVIRGNVYDSKTGEPVSFATVYLKNTKIGTNSDIDGFFNFANVKPGTYIIVTKFVGYDSIATEVKVATGEIAYKRITIAESTLDIGTVEVSAQRQVARTEVQVSKLTVTQRQIKSLPATGGDPDIAQYLPVLPGVIFTGDQGGQMYIRGGSPVQNKILLDGMTIYNPFHSIGFYSVFETEAIRSVDVYTGGFNAENGGRVSAIVDIKTKDGNKKEFSGLVAASPFQSKVLIEGPLLKLKEEGGSAVSFLLTAKKSYLNQTSKTLYKYAAPAGSGLPFSFQDLYGKVSFLAGNGSKLNVFGFNFTDGVDYKDIASIGWKSSGGGANFTLIPAQSNMILGGRVTASSYLATINEADNKPRTSGINGFNAAFDGTYFGDNNEVKFGAEISGFATNFKYVNFVGNTFEQNDNNTELGAFVKYRQKFGNLVIEPSLRLQYYASVPKFSPEPRLGIKYNITDWMRMKFAGGLYSQNLISTVNERDIVNLFVGFLSSPDATLYKPGTKEESKNPLQTSWHAIGGLEFDLNKNVTLNVEPYYKNFTQLININRNKVKASDSDYAAETGKAYGIDLSTKYDKNGLYIWFTYSLGYVNRYDGQQTYPTVFDRRHNINFVSTYNFGKTKLWEAGLRWNMGSGFPFTKTQGFYNYNPFQDGVSTDILTANPKDYGIVYSEKRNSGRLPYYHRLDVSVKRKINFTKHLNMEITASATNAYNRENIFYFDRIKYKRVNQLPILPSLNMTMNF